MNGGNYYKICRNLAGFTQEQASELIGCSISSLQKYEAIKEVTPFSKPRVPDDIVKKMAEICGIPMLAIWHMKNTSVLGAFLPDVQMPQSHGDMGFHTILANDELDQAEAIIKKVLADRRIDPHEYADFQQFLRIINYVAGLLMSVKVYGDTVLSQLEKEEGREDHEKREAS